MTLFPLKIVTPDGVAFEGMAQELVVRTNTGDMGILAGHTNCVAPIGMGRATVVTESGSRTAACIGGMVSVIDGHVTLVPITFEWSEEIDLARAESSKAKAEEILHSEKASSAELKLAEARLKRALVRTSVGKSRSI